MTLAEVISTIFKPKHVQPRYYAATKEENARVRQRKASIVAQLAVYNAVTTPEQRRHDTEAFFAEAAKLRAANSRSMENGRGRG